MNNDFTSERFFADQRRMFEQWNIPTVQNGDAQRQYTPISANLGSGFFELLQFDGLMLGRANVLLHEPWHTANDTQPYCYGLHINLRGYAAYTIPDLNRHIETTAPEIWLRKGKLWRFEADLPADVQLTNIAIDFEAHLIERLMHDSDIPPLLRYLIEQPSPDFIALPKPSAALMAQAWQLYHHTADNGLDRLALQGAAYSFISSLLRHPICQSQPLTRAEHAALRAQILLDQDLAPNWTIRQLARKVGSNECDLKRTFKALTGSTIARYRERQRMQHASTLLQQGENDLQRIADALGYQKDYFVRVFRKTYHHHPKEHQNNPLPDNP